MPASPTGMDAARSERRAKRAAAETAVLAWQDAVLSSLTTLLGEVGAAGTAPVVVFEGTWALPPAGEAFEQREELLSVLFVSAEHRVRLSVTEGEWWAEAVELWGELRAAIARAYVTHVPVAMIVDLAERNVYCYQPWFCPDEGPEPEMVLKLENSDDEPPDPYAQLLGAGDVDLAELDARLAYLLDRYALTPPTVAGHEPGECDGYDIHPDGQRW